jgi:hypothetical protein
MMYQVTPQVNTQRQPGPNLPSFGTPEAQLELLRRWVAAGPLSGAGQLRPQDLIFRFFTKTGLLDET